MKKQVVSVLIDPDLPLPQYATELAAGADVCSASKSDIVIEPAASALIPTGIRMEIPPGYEVQLRPRSGLALKSQITVLNTPATIDADFRGEVKVLLINHGKEPFTVTYRMRIAQMVLAEVTRAEFVVETTLAASSRGEGGFGHTGTH